MNKDVHLTTGANHSQKNNASYQLRSGGKISIVFKRHSRQKPSFTPLEKERIKRVRITQHSGSQGSQINTLRIKSPQNKSPIADKKPSAPEPEAKKSKTTFCPNHFCWPKIPKAYLLLFVFGLTGTMASFVFLLLIFQQLNNY
jgi:hypothetical protein